MTNLKKFKREAMVGHLGRRRRDQRSARRFAQENYSRSKYNGDGTLYAEGTPSEIQLKRFKEGNS